MINPQFASVVPGMREAGRTPLSEKEIVSILQEYNVLTSLERMAFISLVLTRGGSSDASYEGWMINTFTRPELRIGLDQFDRSTPTLRKVPFHASQFRLLLKLLWRHGDLSGGRVLGSEEDWYSLGDVILSLNSTFSANVDVPRVVGNPQQWLAGALMYSHNGFRRSRQLESIYPVKEAVLQDIFTHPDNRNAFLEFTEGISPEELFCGLFALMSFFGQLNSELAKKQPFIMADIEYLFGMCDVRKRVGDYIKSNYCHLLEGGPRAIDDRWEAISDFNFLIKGPFLLIEDRNLICLDWEFTESLVARAIFKVAADAFRSKGLEPIESQQGKPFEQYCVNLIKQISEVREGARTIGPFTEERRELDCAYYEASSVVVCECKGGPLKTSAVMGTDPSIVARYLDEKFIFGVPGTNGAYRQLARRSGGIAADPGLFNLPKGLSEIWPVLIVEDEFVASRPVILYANSRSEDLFRELPAKVRPPVILHVNDLRMIAHRAPQIGLSGALQRWRAQNYIGYDFYTWFLTEFPSSGVAEPGRTIDVCESRPLLAYCDRNMEHALRKNAHSPCPHCGCERGLHSDDSRHFWQCYNGACTDGDRDATPEELLQYIAERNVHRQNYLES